MKIIKYFNSIIIKAVASAFCHLCRFWSYNRNMHTRKNQSYTEAYQKHTDCGCGYKVVCCYDDAFSKLVQICRGKNSFYKFIEKMSEEVEDCKKAAKKHLKNH